MKKKRRFKKRYFPLVLLILILGCNGAGLGDMGMSEKKILNKLSEAGVKNFATQTIQKDGYHIFFAQATNLVITDTTPVFIFAHGTPGSLSNSIAYLMDSTLLNKGISVAYDRPGFGLSIEGKDAYDLDGQLSGLELLMEEFEGRDIYLVGHSYGAPIILQAAMEHAQKVAGLVWLGGVVHTGWKERAWWRRPINYPPIKWLLPTSMVVSNKEMINLQDDLQKIQNRWQEVTCPVIMIQGGQDWLAPPSNTTFADSMLVSSSFRKSVLVPDASHFFYFSKPRYVVESLEQLLDR